MAKTSETPVFDEIVEVAHKLGYKTKINPYEPSFISQLFQGRGFRPDILVTNGGRKTIVVTMANGVGLGHVNLTNQARKNKDTGALICLPDWAFSRISDGTREYAGELGVRLCRLSEVGGVLKELLG